MECLLFAPLCFLVLCLPRHLAGWAGVPSHTPNPVLCTGMGHKAGNYKPRELDQWVKKLKCSGSSGIGIESFPYIKVGVDPSPVKAGMSSHDPYNEQFSEKKDIPGADCENIRLELKNGDIVEGNLRSELRHGLCLTKCGGGDGGDIDNRHYKRSPDTNGKLNGKA